MAFCLDGGHWSDLHDDLSRSVRFHTAFWTSYPRVGRLNGVQSQTADGTFLSFLADARADRGRGVATAARQLEAQVQLTGLDQGRDVVAWVDDLDVVVEGHVTRQDGAPAFLVEGQDGLVFRVHAYGEP